MSENPKNTEEIREYQDRPGGQFQEGNPGKPKGAKNKYSMARLEEAMEDVEKELGKNIFKRFIEMACYNAPMMISLMNKFVANKEKIEHSTDGPLEINIKRINAED